MSEVGDTSVLAPPVVPWTPSAPPGQMAGIGTYAGGRPSITVRALLRDTMARYAADPIRLAAIAALPTLLTFASSLIFTPSSDPSTALAVAPLLGLLAFALGIAGATTTFALLEGGPELSLKDAFRRGVRRSGWLVLTALVLVLMFFVVAIGASIVIGLGSVVILVLGVWPLLILTELILLVVVGWFAVRLGLSIPAVIVDDVSTGDAIKVAWRMTAPLGTWLRVLAAGLLLGLLVTPISFGTVVLDFPAVSGQVTPSAAVSVIVAVTLAPLGGAFAYSAYRRLVPPFWPPWTHVPAPVVDVDGVARIPPPVFRVPDFGVRARIMVVALIALAVLGALLIVYGVSQLLSGDVSLPFPFVPDTNGGGQFPFFSFPPFPTFGP